MAKLKKQRSAAAKLAASSSTAAATTTTTSTTSTSTTPEAATPNTSQPASPISLRVKRAEASTGLSTRPASAVNATSMDNAVVDPSESASTTTGHGGRDSIVRSASNRSIRSTSSASLDPSALPLPSSSPSSTSASPAPAAPGTQASALSLLRDRLTQDEASRIKAAEQPPAPAPTGKLRKKRPSSQVGADSGVQPNHRPRTRTESESASVISYATDEQDLGEGGSGSRGIDDAFAIRDPTAAVEEDIPTSDPDQGEGGPPDEPLQSKYIPASQPRTGIVSKAFYLPRLGLALTQSTMHYSYKTTTSLLSHLPLIGSFIAPAPSPAPSPTTTTASSLPSEAPEEDYATPQPTHSFAWKALEMGLGIGLATVLVAGVSAGLVVEGVRSRRRGWKGKGRE
ncbi:hypothetical protein MNV49_007139 [Pseudohyphozyma bogoriensis]|nr:hypothetical protein MNV49_007139 [Pseudohyphozyma bogoriensis]